MNRFAALRDSLANEPDRNHKLRLLINYFRTEADPDRGWALAAMTDGLAFPRVKAAVVRSLLAQRTDPVLLDLCRAYVGDPLETAALLWPEAAGPVPARDTNRAAGPSLSDIVEVWREAGGVERLPDWLDSLNVAGRWALLKLLTGGLRVDAPARLAKTAVAHLGKIDPVEVEEIWHALEPPYLDLFAWVEDRSTRPKVGRPAPFCRLTPAREINAAELVALEPSDFCAGGKWDGLRVLAVTGFDAGGRAVQRIYGENGEDMSRSFPDLCAALATSGLGDVAIDGDILVQRDGVLHPSGVLRQRLARRSVTARLVAEYPVQLRVGDLLLERNEDLRALSFPDRHARLAAIAGRCDPRQIALTPLLAFTRWTELDSARCDPGRAGPLAGAIEGIVLRRRTAQTGSAPRAPELLSWKRDPRRFAAVLMYVQRAPVNAGLELTFGLWRGDGAEPALVPVGKGALKASPVELARLEHWMQANTSNRFGPVREVLSNAAQGLVVEVAYEGLHHSARHKSGIALVRPRVLHICWEMSAVEAGRLEMLEQLLPD